MLLPPFSLLQRLRALLLHLHHRHLGPLDDQLLPQRRAHPQPHLQPSWHAPSSLMSRRQSQMRRFAKLVCRLHATTPPARLATQSEKHWMIEATTLSLCRARRRFAPQRRSTPKERSQTHLHVAASHCIRIDFSLSVSALSPSTLLFSRSRSGRQQ